MSTGSHPAVMKRALVTGAPGFVGSALCKELRANGYVVKAMHRASSNLAALKGIPVTLVTGDLNDLPRLTELCADVDVVFHIAALFREAKFSDDEYWKVNFEGTKNIFAAARLSGVKRFVYCSTNGVHSHIEHPPANEEAPFNPADVYQRSKAAAEKFCFEDFQRGGIELSVIRPAMIWGPGDRRFLKLFRGVAHRKLPIIGTGTTWTHWILVSDLARAFRLAAERPQANGQAYLIAGNEPVLLRDVYGAIAHTAGVKVLPFRVPAAPLQMLGSAVEAVCRPFGVEPPIFRRRVDFFVKNRAFDCSKAKRDLGFVAAQSFEAEVVKIFESYRAKGWL